MRYRPSCDRCAPWETAHQPTHGLQQPPWLSQLHLVVCSQKRLVASCRTPSRDQPPNQRLLQPLQPPLARDLEERPRLATRDFAHPLTVLHSRVQGLKHGQRVTVSSLYIPVAFTGGREPLNSLSTVLPEKVTRGLENSQVVACLGD
ncbi:hypothetical protein CRG98_019031 [Punica granatum]|uniref:Uncharacterized protein n=1 Tax=Punica granatum TaxID=22663 RepID=A0A2I0JW95_PUNGR|nr:hypothetical protein CRG98_019031 [Punica granatum]